jgi:cellobiose-specific phosphotransferase system component IIC
VAEQEDRPPLAIALEWVSKVTTVALEMVVPGIIGAWMDRRWGTNFITLIGLACGVSVGIWHLLVLTRSENGTGSKRPNSEKTDKDQHP